MIPPGKFSFLIQLPRTSIANKFIQNANSSTLSQLQPIPTPETQNLTPEKRSEQKAEEAQPEAPPTPEDPHDPKGAKALAEKVFLIEMQHRQIIERFGRYPHRNKALGRAMTDEETDYLEKGGQTF